MGAPGEEDAGEKPGAVSQHPTGSLMCRVAFLVTELAKG
jgi:hypothetical protein